MNVCIFLVDRRRPSEGNGAHKLCTPLTVEMNGRRTHLVELNPLLVSLGGRVGDPQGSKLGPEQVGGVLLHGGDVEAEYLGGDPLQAEGQVVCR